MAQKSVPGSGGCGFGKADADGWAPSVVVGCSGYAGGEQTSELPLMIAGIAA